MKSSPQVAADLLLRPPRGFKLNKWKDTLLEYIAPSDMAVIVKLVYSGKSLLLSVKTICFSEYM